VIYSFSFTEAISKSIYEAGCEFAALTQVAAATTTLQTWQPATTSAGRHGDYFCRKTYGTTPLNAYGATNATLVCIFTQEHREITANTPLHSRAQTGDAADPLLQAIFSVVAL